MADRKVIIWAKEGGIMRDNIEDNMVIVWAHVGGILRDKKVNVWAKLGGIMRDKMADKKVIVGIQTSERLPLYDLCVSNSEINRCLT